MLPSGRSRASMASAGDGDDDGVWERLFSVLVASQPAHRASACYAGPDTNPVAIARRTARTKLSARPARVARPVVGAAVTFSSAPLRTPGASVAEPF